MSVLFRTIVASAVMSVPSPGMVSAETAVEAQVYMDCEFATECYEAEGCQEAVFAATLVGRASGDEMIDMAAEIEMRSDNGDVMLAGTLSNGALGLYGGAGLGRHMLSVSADGAARYTVHLANGPQAVTYLGTCEAVQ